MPGPGPNDPASAYSPVATVGKVCWYEGTELPASTVSQEYAVTLQALPAVGEFDDTRIDPEDPTHVQILAAGTYLVTAEATCEADQATTINVQAATNDGWLTGPIGLLKGHAFTPGDGWSISPRISGPADLVVGDYVKVTVTTSAAEATVTGCNLTLLRLSATPGG